MWALARAVRGGLRAIAGGRRRRGLRAIAGGRRRRALQRACVGVLGGRPCGRRWCARRLGSESDQRILVVTRGGLRRRSSLDGFLLLVLLVVLTETEQLAEERRLVHSVLEDACPLVDEPLLEGFVELLQCDDAHVVGGDLYVPEFNVFVLQGVVHGPTSLGESQPGKLFHIVKGPHRLVTKNCADPAKAQNFGHVARYIPVASESMNDRPVKRSVRSSGDRK